MPRPNDDPEHAHPAQPDPHGVREVTSLAARFLAELDAVADPDLRALFAVVRGLPPWTWPAPRDPARMVDIASANRIWGELRLRFEAAGADAPAWAKRSRRELEARWLAVSRTYAARLPVVRAAGEAFAARGLECLALKGLHLASAVYAKPADRPFDNVDLVVRPRDLPAAEAALRSLGFVPGREQTGPGAVEKSFLLQAGGGHLVDVDLHWKLIGPLSLVREMRLDVGDLLARSSPAFPGIRFPSPEDALAVAAVNLVRHGFRPLGNILDFRELFRRSDPSLIVARARETRTAIATSVGLTLAKVTFGAEIDDGVIRALAVPPWQSTILGGMLTPEALARPDAAREFASRILAKIAAQDGPIAVGRTSRVVPRMVRAKMPLIRARLRSHFRWRGGGA